MGLQDGMKDILHFGIGAATILKERVEKEFDELVKNSKLTRDDAKATIDRIFTRGQTEEEELKAKIKESIKEVIGELEIATKSDIDELKKELKGNNS